MGTPLALTALSKGIEQIPDHIWETVPIYRPPKEVRHQRRREQREQEQQQQQDPQGSNDRSPPRKSKSSKDSSRRSSDRPRPKLYAESSAPDQSSRTATDQPERSYQQSQSNQSRNPDSGQEAQRGYDPPIESADVATGYTPNRYLPPGVPQYPNSSGVNPPPMGDNYYAPSDNRRYNPQDYAPRDDYGGGSAYGSGGQNQNLQVQPAGKYRGSDSYAGGRAHSAGPRYDDRYDDDSDSYNSRGRDDHKSKHRKHQSRSRSRGAQHVLHKNFDTTDKGMAYGAIGALAGGALGHHFGKGPIATVAGAVVGGLGANALEARHERRRSGRLEVPHKHSRSRSTDYAGSRGEEAIDSTTRRDLEYYGSRRDRGYDDYSDEDSDRPKRRNSQRSRRKSRGADEDDRRTLSTYENH